MMTNEERYEKAVPKPFDHFGGSCGLWSDAAERYFEDPDAVEHYLDSEGGDLESLQLYCCEPVVIPPLDMDDYLEGMLAEDVWADQVLSEKAQNLLKELNKAFEEHDPICYQANYSFKVDLDDWRARCG